MPTSRTDLSGGYALLCTTEPDQLLPVYVYEIPETISVSGDGPKLTVPVSVYMADQLAHLDREKFRHAIRHLHRMMKQKYSVQITHYPHEPADMVMCIVVDPNNQVIDALRTARRGAADIGIRAARRKAKEKYDIDLEDDQIEVRYFDAINSKP